MGKKGLNIKQRSMLESIRGYLGNVSAACKVVGITRKSHYKWLQTLPAYKEAYEEMLEEVKDFGVSALHAKMKKGDTASIIFFLKTQCKDRGFVERQQFEYQGTQPIKLVFDDIKPDNNSQDTKTEGSVGTPNEPDNH